MNMNHPYDDFPHLLFSNNTATATSTSSCVEQHDGISLDMDWDWDCDFHDLIESMMNDKGTTTESPPLLPCYHGQEESLHPRAGESKGLRLVHLLVAAADASTGADKTRELTRVLLAKLKDMTSPNDRTNMERLAAHFTNGLSKLHREANVQRQCGPHQHPDVYDQVDVMLAFQMLQNMSPYINFGYLTATQAILEAVKHERRIHIVDNDIKDGVQWPSLMQALVSGNTGLSAQHLRITALSRATNGKKSVAAVQEAGRRLTAFAESIGQPFSYHHCRMDSDTFNPSSLKLVRGEAVVINCMLHLPRLSHQPPNSIISFLSEAKTLNPKLVTLVHDEVGLFSAIFDSLEANPARGFVERVIFGPWVSGWLTRIAVTADDAEVDSVASWPMWLATNGFKPVEISFANRFGQNGLVLGWKSRRLVSASFWASCESSE
ncbi:hypothetical protein Bca52824_035912 [Brassica carinata]|uniref:Nodulation signaling pathway 2-like protein n=1 Tax=Brassica carinata TaxID=52824 RepID=A0A8X7S669_BRACI|nr:hypothetical protein Bca52824_035912 [Brassica carinata]